jgi:glycosyltransferase involved in cell wall biosynthesis
MLLNRSIICFAHDWHGDPTSKTHVMRILARENRVLWVNSIGMRRPSVSSRDLKRIVHKLKRGLSACREVEPNLWVVDPLVLPLPGVPAADRLNALVLASRLRGLCRRHRLSRPILWSFLPNVHRLVGRLGESLVVYHCVDEYSAFEGVPREALAAMEHELVRRADLVLTSGQQLRDERRSLNERVYFVPHGVDVAHFSRALERDAALPEDIRGIRRPIVGFFGLVADWVDVDLIAALARARPDWSFVLLGRVVTSVGALDGLSNVHWLGQKPYEALPDYCRAFDVGIVPFRVNDLTLRANPLKLREYLAAGLPVVATDLPEVVRYARWVRFARDLPGFVDGIERSLAARSVTAARERVDAMRPESWTARVEQMCARIEGSLGSGLGVRSRGET